MIVRILLAASDPAARTRLRQLLPVNDAQAEEATAAEWPGGAAIPDCDLMIVAFEDLPGDVNGLVARLRADANRPDLVVAGNGLDAEQRANLLAAGCSAVLPLGVSDAALGAALAEFVRRRSEASQLLQRAAAAPQQAAFGDFLSHSPGMRKFLDMAKKLSRSDSTVLILGETGVGKERLARAIHGQSSRQKGPFVVINCGAVPEALLESELFGHERGAFTGAVRAHRGHFELAHRGTIFLDEIGEMPLHLQVKLLRVIQERTIQRVGGEDALPVDVRIIAATNRDLHAEMQGKRFRSDLYYRLSVVTLEVPPLRERREDIPLLVEAYFDQFRAQMPSSAQRVSAEAMAVMRNYSWPGNIRELINVVERAVLLCDGAEITPHDLPDAVVHAPPAEAPVLATATTGGNGMAPLPGLEERWLERPLAESRNAWNSAFERAYLSGLLKRTRGRIGETAHQAGIDPRSLYAKMKQHGLRKEDFRH